MSKDNKNELLAEKIYEMVENKIVCDLEMSKERTISNIEKELSAIESTQLYYYLMNACDNLGKKGFIKRPSTRNQKIASYILSCVDTTLFSTTSYKDAYENIIKDLNDLEYENLHLYYYLRNAKEINRYCNMEYLESVVNEISEKLHLDFDFIGLDGLSLTWDFENGSYLTNFNGYGLYFGSGKPLMKNTIRYYENPNELEDCDTKEFIEEIVEEFKDYENFTKYVNEQYPNRLNL